MKEKTQKKELEGLKRIALIPSFKPNEKIINLVKELKNNHIIPVIVDDGSGNEYKKYFNQCNAKVISYSKNQGKGFALKTGLKYIKNNYEKFIVVTVDCDGQHKVSDAIKLLKIAEENPNTLILGKRIRNKKTPIRSLIGNNITRFIYKIVTGINIYDTQTGLRAFSNNLINYMLNIEGNRYEYEMNVLLNTKNNNIKIIETEIETIYIENNKASHFNTLKDSFKIYKEILKYSTSSIISFFIDYLCYSLFIILIKNIIFSNILSRIISSIFNFILNKKLVFRSNHNLKQELLKYYSLVTIILILNTIVLKILTLIINPYIAKLITEIILFILSYFIQKKYIFKGHNIYQEK